GIAPSIPELVSDRLVRPFRTRRSVIAHVSARTADKGHMRSWRLVRSTALPNSDGFTLAEVVFGLAIFLIVATALGGLLPPSVITYGQSRERTLAIQSAMDQIEQIRHMPYASVGVTNGNPPGTLQATRSIAASGLKATMTVEVHYVDDQTPNAYRT